MEWNGKTAMQCMCCIRDNYRLSLQRFQDNPQIQKELYLMKNLPIW